MKQIIRTESAGVFFAEVVSRNGSEAVLSDSRRLWYWSGAASLSQLAMEGTKAPSGCKFPVSVTRQEVLGIIEIIDCTQQAIDSIEATPIWSA